MPKTSAEQVERILKFIKFHGYENVESALQDIEQSILQAAVDKLSYSDDAEYQQISKHMDSEPQYVGRRGLQPGGRDRTTRLLPYCWSERDADELLAHFGGCALSNVTTDIELDHFIPVSWGHGGTYVGNMIPLSKELNRLKDNSNPFDWIEDREVRRLIVPDKWDRLLNYLAGMHHTTVQEFERYVRWCSVHQRARADGIQFSTFSIWELQSSK